MVSPKAAGRGPVGGGALVGQAVAHLRRLAGGLQHGGEPVADRRRQPGGAEDAVPVVGQQFGVADLGGDRQLGGRGVALPAGQDHGRQRAAADMRHDDGQVGEQQLDRAAEQVGHRRRRAAIGHHRHVEPGLAAEQLGRQVGDAGRAGGADVQLARVAAAVVEQPGHVLHAERGRRHQRLRHQGEDAERGEVLRHPVGHVGADMRQDDQRAAAGDDQGIAVGRRLGRGIDADGAAGAAAVLDHHRLLQHGRHRLGIEPGDDVVRPAGGIGDQQADRAVRPFRRSGPGRGRARLAGPRRRPAGGGGAALAFPPVLPGMMRRRAASAKGGYQRGCGSA